MVATWQYPGTLLKLSWNWQEAREVLLVRQFYASLGAKLLYPKFWLNYGIVLAKIKRNFTAHFFSKMCVAKKCIYC